MDQGTAFQSGIDPHNTRSCLYEFFETTDNRLLGDSCASDRADCVGAGWPGANDKNARLRLIFTQALHWFAFLLVMNMMLLPSVQKILNPSATGLAVLTLLALGTFTAGTHVLSWQVCLLGLIMALCVPAAAWIEASALIIVLIAIAVLGIGLVLWWFWHETRAHGHELSGRMS